MKPPSRKHYEKTKPTYKEMEDRLAILEHKLLNAQQYERELKIEAHGLRTVADWFDVLKRSEVMVATPEGMKYLVGQDLEDFCRAEMEKQNSNKIWWDEIGTSAFSGFANQAISQIIRDEIDKCALSDSFTYQTKGRYDTRSKSKKESS